MKLSKLRASCGTTRKVNGGEVPRHNTTSKAFQAALKKANHAPYAGESGEVDGDRAKSRLDRPGRRHGGKVHHAEHHDEKKHGGMACKKDGGDVKDKDLKAYHDLEGAERKHGGSAKEPHKDHHDKHHEAHKKDGGKTPHFLENIKKGALRKELGVKEGEKIPAKKLEKAAHSDNPTLKKRAVLAENMKHFHHGKHH